MAYFECIYGSGSGGTGIPLVVTCASAFAGLTITCTDGTTTLTDTCPSSSPYEITFNLPNTGTWTVSGTISGQSYSVYVTVTDFETELNNIPDGATKTPTDDVQILLNCANIWDKSYTTISDLLADTTSLLAVISDNNAVDYLVRSTTFATDICADSTAMTYIGADNYCADTLLADSTWRNAICNSTYFESVLNVKVPTMTSDTTPSGETFETSRNQTGSHYAWRAFDGDSTTFASSSNGGIPYGIGYKFTSSKTVYMCRFNVLKEGTSVHGKNYVVQYSDDNSTWNDIDDTSGVNTSNDLITKIFNGVTHLYFRLYFSTSYTTYCALTMLQFYGRAAT